MTDTMQAVLNELVYGMNRGAGSDSIPGNSLPLLYHQWHPHLQHDNIGTAYETLVASHGWLMGQCKVNGQAEVALRGAGGQMPWV
jgi:hypothetical protein